MHLTQAEDKNTLAAPAAIPPKQINGKSALRPRSSLRREYVAAGGNLGIDFETLPLHIDSITADFGNDLYDRMLLYPQCAAAVNLLKLAIISQGVTLQNPRKESDPEYAQAQTILEFCQRNHERLDQPQRQILFELLDALAYGNKVGEQIWEIPEVGPDAGMLCLKAIHVKPRTSVAFVVDTFKNVVAIAAARADKPGSAIVNRNFFTSGGDTSALLPREKFVVFSYRTKDNDPRGSSVLRAAYGSWWLAMQLIPEYTKYLSNFATPQIIVNLPPDTMTTMLTDPLGNLIDENGDPIPEGEMGVEENPADLVLDKLLQWRNSFGLVLDYDMESKLVQAAGEGQPFLLAFSYLDDGIVQSILSQKLATSESANMARAASQVHQDVLDLVIGEGKSALCDQWRQDVILRLVEYNYGPQACHLAPTVSLPETEHQDFPAVANAVAALMRSGYLSQSQLPKLDKQIGVPIRDESPDNLMLVQSKAATPPGPETEEVEGERIPNDAAA